VLSWLRKFIFYFLKGVKAMENLLETIEVRYSSYIRANSHYVATVYSVAALDRFVSEGLARIEEGLKDGCVYYNGQDFYMISPVWGRKGREVSYCILGHSFGEVRKRTKVVGVARILDKRIASYKKQLEKLAKKYRKAGIINNHPNPAKR
jgi:hypothetical protein